MIFFADSSFLASLYLIDANHGAAKRMMHRLDPTLPLTEFGALELKNTIRNAVFRKAITISAAEGALRQVERDSAAGILAPIPCPWRNILQMAESLSRRHTFFIGCRALDILQVAAALVLGCKEFLTFDQRQSKLAQQAGLSTPS